MQTIINNKKSYIEKGYDSFDDTYVNNFNQKYDEILLEGLEEIRTKPKGHYSQAENALILRILEYKDNYFIWMYDFSLPSDDNLSERALRTAKSKMKVSGQFQNINYARYYADIKTYIETCYRNGINPTSALIDLMNKSVSEYEWRLYIASDGDDALPKVLERVEKGLDQIIETENYYIGGESQNG